MQMPSLKNTLVALAAACGTLAAGLAPGSAAAAEFSVGLRSLPVPYHGGVIDTSVWYPTLATASKRDFGPFAPTVAVGAQLAEAEAGPGNGASNGAGKGVGDRVGKATPGRLPVVLISHGTGGTAMNHFLQAEALARAGFVVVSLVHPGDNFQDRSLIADPRYLFERPRQASAVLDALLASPDWKDKVDAARIGAFGHSAGGYTVAALIGGVPDLPRLLAHCQSVTDDPSCALRDPQQFVAPSARKPLVLPDTVLAQGDVRDPRVRAAVITAPFAAALQPGSMQATTASVRLLGAQFDEVLPSRYHYDYLLRELPQGRPDVSARVMAGAGHMSFIVPVQPAWKERMGPVAVDPAGFDRAALHAALSEEVVTFFQQALRP